MKEILRISVLLMLIPSFLSAQGGIINDNAKIQVSSGTMIKIGGGVINQNSGAITNEGNMYVEADWTQIGAAASYTGNGWMWFENGTNQSLTSVSALVVRNLRVNNGGKLILGSNLTVSKEVDLMINGSIELGVNNLVLSTGANLNGYGVNNYIITNSTGTLQQEVGGTNTVFPVGNSTYNPATLNNSGTKDDFTIRVDDQVFDEGTTGPVLTTDVVDRTWLIEEGVVGGSIITMVLQWEQGEELASFDRANSGIAHHNSGSLWYNPATYTPATNIVVNTTWTQTDSGFTNFSPFVVRSINADLPVEMLYFNAKRINANLVELDWVTESETNNDGFFVERMLENESSFKELGFVDGNGTIVTTTYYEYGDANSYSGISYYRLRQVDFDGSYSYSSIKAVEGKKNNQIVSFFPNPVDDFINIRITRPGEKLQIRIVDIKGSEIMSSQINFPTDQLVQIQNLSSLVPATYILTVQIDDVETYNHKFIKK